MANGLILKRAHQPGLELGAVIAAAPDGAIGFLYGPRRALWARKVRGALELPESSLAELAPFELRLFDGSAEWRWLKGRGAAWIAEGGAAPGGWTSLPELACTALAGAQLLWGTAAPGPSAGWTTMASPRTGPYQVPATILANKGAALASIRYLARRDIHGNVGVVEERLTGLRPANFLEEEAK